MSQNQFPGQNPQPGVPQQPQGGQPYPQGGQQVPQPGGQYPAQGGQPYPQGGQPYPQGGHQVPQPGGQYPAQGGQPYPHGPYSPTGAQPVGATFGQRPVGGQYGQQPGYQPGFPPQPPKPKANGTVIGVVIAGLVAVGLAGWLLMILFGGGNDPAPTPTPTVTSTTAPTAAPSPTPSTDPDPSPSSAAPGATASPSSTTASGALEVGLGVSVAAADGWAQTSRNELKSYTELSNGKALLATQAFQVQGQVTGTDVVAAYVKQVTGNMTGVTISKQPAVVDAKSDRLSVGIAGWSGTRATAQGSVKLQYVSIISVRDDGLAVMSTLIVPSGSTVSAQQADYLAMTNSLLSSQLQA